MVQHVPIPLPFEMVPGAGASVTGAPVASVNAVNNACDTITGAGIGFSLKGLTLPRNRHRGFAIGAAARSGAGR